MLWCLWTWIGWRWCGRWLMCGKRPWPRELHRGWSCSGGRPGQHLHCPLFYNITCSQFLNWDVGCSPTKSVWVSSSRVEVRGVVDSARTIRRQNRFNDLGTETKLFQELLVLWWDSNGFPSVFALPAIQSLTGSYHRRCRQSCCRMRVTSCKKEALVSIVITLITSHLQRSSFLHSTTLTLSTQFFFNRKRHFPSLLIFAPKSLEPSFFNRMKNNRNPMRINRNQKTQQSQ